MAVYIQVTLVVSSLSPAISWVLSLALESVRSWMNDKAFLDNRTPLQISDILMEMEVSEGYIKEIANNWGIQDGLPIEKFMKRIKERPEY